VADAVARNKTLVADQLLADVGLWGAVGGSVELATGGLGALMKKMRRTAGSRVLNEDRLRALGTSHSTRDELTEAMELGDTAYHNGSRLEMKLLDRSGELSGRGSVARLAAHPEIQAALRHTEAEFVDEAASRAGMSLHKSLSAVDSALEDVTPIASVAELGDFHPNTRQVGLSAMDELGKATPLDALHSEQLTPLTQAARAPDTRSLDDIYQQYVHLSRRASTVARSGSADELTRLYVDAVETSKQLHLHAQAAHSEPVRVAIRETREQLNDLLGNEAVWGPIAAAQANRRDALRTFLTARTEIAGGAFREATPLSIGTRAKTTLRMVGTPAGKQEVLGLLDQIKAVEDTVRNYPRFFPNAQPMLAELRNATAAIKDARFGKMAHQLSRSLRHGDIPGGGAGITAELGGLYIGGPLTAFAMGAAKRLARYRSSPYATFERYFNTAHVLRNAATTAERQAAGVRAALSAAPRSRAVAFIAARGMLGAGDKRQTEVEFNQAADHLERLGNFHEDFLDEIERTSAPADDISPGVGHAIRERMITGVSYLMGHMPSRARNPITGKAAQVSRAEMSSFMQRFNALEYPHLLLDKLVDGSLTHEAVDAVKTVMPDLYAEQALTVLTELVEHKGSIPFQTRLQLSIFFGVPEASTSGDMLTMLQSNYYQTPAQAGAVLSPSRRSAPNLSQSEATSNQSLRS
jgi:hypothetical protein